MICCHTKPVRGIFCWIGAIFLVGNSFAGSRILEPTPGAVLAKNLPEGFTTKVKSITYHIYDAFEGSKVHTPIEAEMFEIGNKLHIESSHKTIHRRLIFDKNETVTREQLLESEKLLRSEQFLADAMIEVKDLGEGTSEIIVNTFDQFSTAPGVGFQKPAGEWEYWFGIIESNFMGTGQKLGGFYSKDVDRSTYYGLYENKAFLSRNFTLKGTAGQSSDGYFYNYFLGRPLVSKSQDWGYSFSGDGIKSTRHFYLDSDLPGLSEILADTTKTLFYYKDIVNLNFSLNITRSFGKKNKSNVSLVFDHQEKYLDADDNATLLRSTAFDGTGYELFDPRDEYALDFRLDNLLGVTYSFYQSDYKTVRNFRNMKWSEDLDVGFRITNGVYQNVTPLGAKNSDLHITHKLIYINVWSNAHFVTTNLSTQYFLGYDGDVEDGLLNHFVEYQWKPVPRTATYFSSSWANYYQKEKSAQMLLGGEEGLSSYPNRYFAGQARLFLQAEQRYFPDFEIATGVPAFAVFLKGGNVWPSYRHFEWDELHYSAGLGLRLGQSRSVQKVVNHLDISFPIDKKYREILPNWRFTLLAKTNL